MSYTCRKLDVRPTIIQKGTENDYEKQIIDKKPSTLYFTTFAIISQIIDKITFIDTIFVTVFKNQLILFLLNLLIFALILLKGKLL